MLSHSGHSNKGYFLCQFQRNSAIHQNKLSSARYITKHEAVIDGLLLVFLLCFGWIFRQTVGCCFSYDSTVKLQNGVNLQVRNLKVGDFVQVMTQQGKIGFSEVMMFADYKPDIPHALHLLIETKKPAKHITLTPSHLIFTTSNSTGTQLHSKHAGNVLPGEFILVSANGRLVPSQVKRVSLVKRTGLVAPVTMEGNVIVDGVLSSCYAMISDHEIAHIAFGPLRLIHIYAPSLWNAGGFHVQQGLHWYPEFLMTINKAFGVVELS